MTFYTNFDHDIIIIFFNSEILIHHHACVIYTVIKLKNHYEISNMKLFSSIVSDFWTPQSQLLYI